MCCFFNASQFGLAILFAMLLANSTLYAQQDDCGFVAPPNMLGTNNPLLGLFDESELDDVMCTESVKTIPIVVHVLLGPEETQTSVEITDVTVKEAIRKTNLWYRTNKSFNAVGHDAKIQFSLAGLDPNGNATTGILYETIQNPYFHNAPLPDGSTPECNDHLRLTNGDIVAWNTNNYINVYIVKGITGGFLSGLAYFGGEAYVDRGHYNTTVLAHELGHTISLFHTFNNSVPLTSDICDDAVTCHTLGDQVCDTPAQLTSNQGDCQLGNNSCINSAPNARTNIMGSGACSRDQFSIGQAARMHEYLYLPAYTAGAYFCDGTVIDDIVATQPINLWSTSNLIATGVVPIDYNTTQVVAGQFLDFEAENILPNATYEWKLGTTVISNTNVVHYQPTTVGSYTLQLTTNFTNPSGIACSRVDKYAIMVIGTLGLTIQPDNSITQDITINTNTYWHNQQMVINGNIIVQSGVTLTIDGGVFEFSNYGAIIVQEGGTLIICSYPQSPTVFKGKFDTNCNRLAWGGIRSWGTVTFEYQCTDLNAGLAATVTPTSPACLSSTSSISGSTTSTTAERMELYQADINPSNYAQNFGMPLQSDTQAPFSVTQSTNLAATTYTFATKYTNLCSSVLLESAPLVVYKKLNLTQPSAGINIAENSGTADNGTICMGSPISLTATGGTSYNWTRPTGSTSTANPQSFTNPSTNPQGLYTVTVTDAAGCTASTSTIVTVYSLPVVSITGYTTAVCAGTPVTLTATGGTYLWSNGGATTASYTPNTSVAGTTTYTVTVTNANGCTKTATKTVVVNALPTAVIAGNNSVCAGGTTTITASGGGTYLWSNGATSAGITIPAGTYTVTVTNSGCTATASKTITTNVVVAAIAGNNSVCDGGTTTITASGGGTYLWSNGATSAGITIPAGTYTVTVTNSGCTATASKTITTNPLPTAAIAGSNSVCTGSTIPITASGGTSYTWSNGANGAVNNVSAGTYTVTVTNANGCTNVATKAISALPLPQVSITTSPINECSLLLTATATGGTGSYTYQWWDNSTAQTYIATTAVTAQVAATDANGCQALANITLTYNQVAPANFDGTYTVGAMGANSFATPDAGGNETWTSLTKRFAGLLIVPAGKTLTLQSSTIEMLSPDTKILIEPDGRLNLNGSTLRGDACNNNNFWSGIEIQGLDIPYTSADFETLDATHNYGALYADLSTIRDALVAINNGVGIRAGGIMYLTGSTFEDNDVSVRLSPLTFSAAQPHTISACTFNMVRNTPHAATWWATDVNQPIGIWAKGLKLPNTLYNNRFISTMASTTPKDKRGIGMRLDNVQAKIDATPEPDPTAPVIYEFEGLFKGVDAANLTTVQKYLSLQRQDFRDTRKAATFANTYGSTINQCSFEVPAGSTDLLDTYGLLCQASQGFEVSSNRFTTAANNAYTRGAIFYKANQTGFTSLVKNNLFDGAFDAATQFQNDNIKLRTNCNAYDDCQTDWHLTNTAILPEQGACDPLDANKALRTHWHYTTELGTSLPYANEHIINDNSSFQLKLNIDNSPQSEPTVVSSGVDVIHCSTDESFDNLSCTVTFPTEGAGLLAGNCDGNVEQRIYNYMRQDQRDSLLALLHCVNTEWAIKILVGTYVDEKQYTLALTELQKLDTTKTENIEFIALYNAIMDGSFNPNAGGRMATTANTQRVANNPQSDNKTLAETALALFRDAEYVRYGVPINRKTGFSNSFQHSFAIAPNPSNGLVTFTFYVPIENNAYLYIYDFSGRLIQTLTVNKGITQLSTNFNGLNSGIYYCRLSTQTNSEKLVIIR